MSSLERLECEECGKYQEGKCDTLCEPLTMLPHFTQKHGHTIFSATRLLDAHQQPTGSTNTEWGRQPSLNEESSAGFGSD